MKKIIVNFALLSALSGGIQMAYATTPVDPSLPNTDCSALPRWSELQRQLIAAQSVANGGFSLQMWATMVNRDGFVCAVAYSGDDRNLQWPGSRVISAQKANTANAFSLPTLALSTANLYYAVQPGGSLFGLQHSNPVNEALAYAGPVGNYGQETDPMVGQRIGGVNVFGGGLALYGPTGTLVGAIGVSGDSSCADHNIAWRTRHQLGLDFVPGGVNDKDPNRPDNIIYDIHTPPGLETGVSTSGWGHPACNGYKAGSAADLSTSLPAITHIIRTVSH